jgi:hypothetical protein
MKCPLLNLNCPWSAEISFAVPKMKVFVFRSVDAQKEVFPTELTLKYTVSKVVDIGHISRSVGDPDSVGSASFWRIRIRNHFNQCKA